MTSILGIQCRDGIVIGADSMITMRAAHGDIQLDGIKVHLLGERGIVAFAGDVGVSQSVLDHLETQWSLIADAENKMEARELILQSVQRATGFQPGVPERPVERPDFACLVGLTIQNKPVLWMFMDTPPAREARNGLYFLTAGSGQHFVFLFQKFLERIFWRGAAPSTISEGIFSAMWTLSHIIDANATLGIGGPPQIAVLEARAPDGDWHARLLTASEFGEHQQQIQTLESAMRQVKEVWSAG
ncbi:MAG: hypothetical protein OXF63_03150 [Anaerolineaceae bacterium]|nr:hypothetical protein [Anaerolineaceae bacterium]